MRLKFKLLIFIAIIWMAFLCFAFTDEVRESWYNFIALAMLFSAFLYLVIYALLLKRIEMLTQQISELNLRQRQRASIAVGGSDEVAAIALQINALLLKLHHLQLLASSYEKKKIKRSKTVNHDS